MFKKTALRNNHSGRDIVLGLSAGCYAVKLHEQNLLPICAVD
ncbi:hypothetical protein HMPREF0454_02331 [Hafnia alvei ATCC 51873]|uniref:Uncharacterized protein n=1 Tax=Hafnia alvei ATCC 51873 TaxID=1002364 RepID=G9Y6W1_HAFAL|nr:hypothetical protein HMPREF0454_02331 [Hafnia alvei ATCC 51873]